jgi:hypothetical protein
MALIPMFWGRADIVGEGLKCRGVFQVFQHNAEWGKKEGSEEEVRKIL